jgi:hypothetical protein
LAKTININKYKRVYSVKVYNQKHALTCNRAWNASTSATFMSRDANGTEATPKSGKIEIAASVAVITFVTVELVVERASSIAATNSDVIC